MKHFYDWTEEDWAIFREGVITAVTMLLEERWPYFSQFFNQKINSREELEKCVEKIEREMKELVKKIMDELTKKGAVS